MSEPSATEVKERYWQVQEQISAAVLHSGRDPASVKLVCVSKFVGISSIIALIEEGQSDFGESYLQEGLGKLRELRSLGYRPDCHFVGRLQSNKVREAVGVFSLIHSVDRLKLARLLDLEAAKKACVQDILIQVNISREPSKGGVLPESALYLARQIANFQFLNLQGLMCLGTVLEKAADEAVLRSEFSEMRKLQVEIEQVTGKALPVLSMGTTGDFSIAIEEGATLIRVGTAVFGER